MYLLRKYKDIRVAFILLHFYSTRSLFINKIWNVKIVLTYHITLCRAMQSFRINKGGFIVIFYQVHLNCVYFLLYEISHWNPRHLYVHTTKIIIKKKGRRAEERQFVRHSHVVTFEIKPRIAQQQYCQQTAYWNYYSRELRRNRNIIWLSEV